MPGSKAVFGGEHPVYLRRTGAFIIHVGNFEIKIIEL
jgi:hypothetical protein